MGWGTIGFLLRGEESGNEGGGLIFTEKSCFFDETQGLTLVLHR